MDLGNFIFIPPPTVFFGAKACITVIQQIQKWPYP
jgi:hypothetical protein